VTTLLESKAKPYGSKKGAVVSMALHGALIAGAVVASGNAMIPEREKIEEHAVLYVAPPPPKVHVAPPPLPEVKRPPAPKTPARAQPPQMRAPTPPRQQAAPRPAQPQPTPIAAAPLVAPISVPTSIPAVDVNALPTVNVALPEPSRVTAGSDAPSRAKSSSDGDVDGSASAKKGGLSSGDASKTYTENQVEEAARPTRQPPPRYPDALKSVNVQGEVIAQYVVDARGRVEPGSIKILSASHKLFGDAVRTALLEARFRPAKVGGTSVRQLVEQPFVFKLQ
jgi:TonB family protein